MPLLGFQKQFVPAIENSLAILDAEPLPHPDVIPKTQTVRAFRKDHKDPKPGDMLHLYVGLRTKGSRQLGIVRCVATELFRINAKGTPILAGKELGPRERQMLARRDGFVGGKQYGGSSYALMVRWFRETHGLPFEGLLIRWGK